MDDLRLDYDDFIRSGSYPGFASLPVPKPSLGMEFYQAERERCLAADPRKRANYERYLKSTRRVADVDYLPVRLDVENVSRCNLACTMCVVSDWSKSKRADDMSVADFRALLDEQYGLVEIKIQGLGEPSMHGDALFEMVRLARERHIWVRTTTNATRLHLNEMARKYVDSGITEIQVSVDGATREVYEGIRRGAVYEQVKANCKRLNAYCRETGRRVTKMWFLVQSANRHQCLDMVDVAAELGFEDLAYSYSLVSWGSERWRDINAPKAVDERTDLELMHRILARGAQLGVRVGFWVSDAKYDSSTPETLCSWPFERAMVTSDLRTVPCCTISNPESFEIGRGGGKSLGELWFSDEYRKFRQAHLDGQIPDVCKQCYVR